MKIGGLKLRLLNLFYVTNEIFRLHALIILFKFACCLSRQVGENCPTIYQQLKSNVSD